MNYFERFRLDNYGIFGDVFLNIGSGDFNREIGTHTTLNDKNKLGGLKTEFLFKFARLVTAGNIMVNSVHFHVTIVE